MCASRYRYCCGNRSVLLKLVQTSLRDFVKCRFWFRRTLHFLQAPRWCWCCWSPTLISLVKKLKPRPLSFLSSDVSLQKPLWNKAIAHSLFLFLCNLICKSCSSIHKVLAFLFFRAQKPLYLDSAPPKSWGSWLLGNMVLLFRSAGGKLPLWLRINSCRMERTT